MCSLHSTVVPGAETSHVVPVSLPVLAPRGTGEAPLSLLSPCQGWRLHSLCSFYSSSVGQHEYLCFCHTVHTKVINQVTNLSRILFLWNSECCDLCWCCTEDRLSNLNSHSRTSPKAPKSKSTLIFLHRSASIAVYRDTTCLCSGWDENSV